VDPSHSFMRLLRQYPVKRYAAHDMVLYQGEVPDAAYIVKSGIVKSYNISAQGDEKPIAFRSENEPLASAWIFGKSNSAMYFYEAHTDSVLYAVPRDDFLKIAHKNLEITSYLLDHYVTLHTADSLQLHALEYSKAADKILHMLFYLMQVYGKDVEEGQVLIDLALTQQELANLLGLTRETTGIELLKLKRSGLLTLSKKKYQVDRKRLLQLIGETEFEDLSL
jgi:CRP/FNR family transcriptional regulator, cyclic AMP receptor protein